MPAPARMDVLPGPPNRNLESPLSAFGEYAIDRRGAAFLWYGYKGLPPGPLAGRKLIAPAPVCERPSLPSAPRWLNHVPMGMLVETCWPLASWTGGMRENRSP